MKATNECLVCFIYQAYKSAKIATEDEELQRRIIIEVANQLQYMDMSHSPAELSQIIYEIVSNITGNKDPYIKQKKSQNEIALKIEPALRELRDKSDDPLLTSLKLSAEGNVIDLGVLSEHQIDINSILTHATKINFAVNHYEFFVKDLKHAKKILFFLDNAGEIVFDKILIEKLKEYADVTAVVKGKPIINDACIEDAIEVGLDKVANVIAMEKGWIGAPWRILEKSLLKRMDEANIIIGKGQGNYETLDDYPGNVYLLLKAKCSVVAKSMGVKEGEIGFISTRQKSK
ncbi:MAG: ARMT1-like domain-containing protein [Candidatus Hydrogenedentes bacterium]|nr:ARMT1-like domain-containing protein [Candidatus Hydrogenedentota bacterium]